jgi:D-alanyl-D-alanine carboxypeptidase
MSDHPIVPADLIPMHGRQGIALLLAGLMVLAGSPDAGARGKSEPLHPAFTFTARELPTLLEGMPPAVATRISGKANAFLARMLSVMDGSQDLLALVDKTHALVSAFVPADLVPLGQYPVETNKQGMKLRSGVMPDLIAMAEAARAAGAVLTVSSAYRSYAMQEALFAVELKTRPREAVEQELAVPGRSQHQLGTVIDLAPIDTSFNDTPAGQWMRGNAWRHGFSLSFPKGADSVTGYTWEPWHFRYVGRAAATLIHEYFDDGQQVFLAWYAAQRESLARHRIAVRGPGAG